MRRRQVITGLAATGFGTAIAHPLQASLAQHPTVQPSIRPPRLSPGDRVGIFSPAGATFRPTELEIVKDAVQGLELEPVVAPHALERYGYLAGTDAQRAADVNQLFADPAIAALLPIRGDWGSARILPYLDYALIRQNPKVVIG